MTRLVDKIVAVHAALDSAGIPHAFGGALALAWCTQRARGTIDIDVNVFVSADQTDAVLAALPAEVTWSPAERDLLERDGQVRIWWGETPVDVFLDTTDFHHDVGNRVRHESFAGAQVPFLACRDLAVFKAFFDRTKDWADLEEMNANGSLDIDAVTGVLVRYLGGADERITRLQALRARGA
ncbi:MAG: hypothetical protein ACE37B_17310 [Ilumatobacter sp.]|uniref:hypothetical protein n=1 Tax=Ilumatobacter sp. TaxID=1967498 RepID=UPI003919FB5E